MFYSTNLLLCDSCIKGKMYRQPSYKEMPLASAKLVEVYCDLCIMPNESIGKATSFAYIIDSATRYKTILFLKKKSDFPSAFKGWASKVEKESRKKIKKLIQRLLTNNGGEFISSEFEQWLKDEGIVHLRTLAHTSEMNPVAERANRTLVETAKSMLE